MNTRIWHNKVSEKWIEALPIGNGRIGAMFFGLPDRERIEINEESLWSGKPVEETYSMTPEVLEEIRSLLFEEKNEEALDVAKKHYLATPNRLRFFECFGRIIIDFSDKTEAQDYYRFLELSTAVAGTEYTKSGIKYITESFVSEKYDTLCYSTKTQNGEKFDCSITMERDTEDVSPFNQNEIIVREVDNTVLATDSETIKMYGTVAWTYHPERGEAGKGMSFSAVLKIKTDGKSTKVGSIINVVGATYLKIYGAFETNYDVEKFDFDETIDIKKISNDKCEKVCRADYEDVKNQHIKDHQEVFLTSSIEINGKKEKLDIPTDELYRRADKGDVDFGYLELYYNFSRYLLIESSGKNAKLPANLQGNWSKGFCPAWCCDYHTNINMQENYWPCETTNLSSTFDPVTHFMKKLSGYGKDTAKKLYNANGWTVHHCTDVFGRTGVHDRVECGALPMAGPWMCLHLFEHYEFTNDLEYLKEVYDVLKGSCEFILDFLVESPEGYLVTNPSNSPENKFYYYENGEKKISMFTYGSTIDTQIVETIFKRMISACKMLGRDEEFVKTLEEVLKRLMPYRISQRYGTICEWIKDYEEVQPGHHHVSHLFGLFPSDIISDDAPELMQAAKKTVDRRIENGSGGEGMTRAWFVLFYARLKESISAWENLKKHIGSCAGPNVLNISRATGVDLFQIEGNFAGCAAIAEMLIQSHRGTVGDRIVEILPAIPKDWESGCVKGLKTRGNFEFDITWENCALKEIVITSNTDNTLKIMLSEIMKGFKTSKEHSVDGDVLSIMMTEGEKVTINF